MLLAPLLLVYVYLYSCLSNSLWIIRHLILYMIIFMCVDPFMHNIYIYILFYIYIYICMLFLLWRGLIWRLLGCDVPELNCSSLCKFSLDLLQELPMIPRQAVPLASPVNRGGFLIQRQDGVDTPSYRTRKSKTKHPGFCFIYIYREREREKREREGYTYIQTYTMVATLT